MKPHAQYGLHAFNAVLTFTISDGVKVDLDVTNTDNQPWRCSGALHSYFNVSNAQDCHITGMGSEYLDSLNGNEITLGGDELPINCSIDRVYRTPKRQVQIHDPAKQRVINVENDGHNAVVIWNPWEEITQGMGDMAKDGYKTMVCVESTYFARDLESGQEVKPGKTFSLSTLVSTHS